MLDSRHWKSAETAATLPFQLDGDAIPATRTSARRTWISTAEGVVVRASAGVVWFEEGDDALVSLRHALPAVVELGALLGRRVRTTLVHAATVDGGFAQTLTISGCDGRPLVIAHAGEVKGIAHTLGKLRVYVALSQRPGGPMVFGTARVQSLVRVGDHVRVRDQDDVYVMCFEQRGASDASYVLVAEDLWRGPPSTRR